MAVSRRRNIIGAVVLAMLWGVILSAIYSSNDCVDLVARGKEMALKGDLGLLHSSMRMYTADQKHRLVSLQDLVTAGYIKRLPIDPIMSRSDHWVVEVSSIPDDPGIVDVRCLFLGKRQGDEVLGLVS